MKSWKIIIVRLAFQLTTAAVKLLLHCIIVSRTCPFVVDVGPKKGEKTDIEMKEFA